MKPTTRRTGIAAMLLAATLLLSACQNLPRRVAGARCKTVGEHAQDGTWVLKCGSNKRWNKLMTIAAANDAVANWLRSQAPTPGPAPAPPSTTTPPPPPPTTRFGQIDSGEVGDGPYFIPPGRYSTVVPPGAACIIQVFGAGVDRARGGSAGPLYIDLSAGTWVRTRGACQWSLGEPGLQTMPANGDGMYRVGTEIQPGLYTAPGSAACYWETAVNADASIASVTDIYYGAGPQLVSIEAGDRMFVSDDCGPWTPLTTVPGRYVDVISSPDNYAFQGLRAFYRDGEVTVTPGFETRVVTAGFMVHLYAPSGGSFSNGTFAIDRVPDPTKVRVDIGAAGRGCNQIPGTATVSGVVLGGSNEPTSMRITIDGECDGQPFLLDIKY